jgi:L-2-hydroxyglutarate oxidase LhgO
MTESQLKQVIEFAHQAGQRNAGIDASPKAARDYYQSLVQDGGLSFVSNSACKHCGKLKTEHSAASKMCSNGFKFFEADC